MKPTITAANMKANKIYLGLGSNLGDREKNLEKAISEISEFASVVLKSSVYESKPVGYTDQDDFLNMVIEIESELAPRELLGKLLQIESNLGRVRTIKNGPRTIDVDILLYGDLSLNEEDLIIPHPRMNERNFVLIPLSEIAPELFNLKPWILKK